MHLLLIAHDRRLRFFSLDAPPLFFALSPALLSFIFVLGHPHGSLEGVAPCCIVHVCS